MRTPPTAPVFAPCNAQDADALVELVGAYYAHDHIAFDPIMVRQGLDALLGDPALGGAWWVRVDGATVGYFVLTYGFDVEFGGRPATVTDLFLLPHARGAGVGRAALGFIEETLAGLGMGAYELQVERANANARAFYQRLGFDAHDRIPLSKSVGSLRSPRGASRTHTPDARRGPGTRVAAEHPHIRTTTPGETDALVALALDTGLFTAEEANVLLRRTLDDLHAGRLGDGHVAYVIVSPDDGAAVGWAYASDNPRSNGVWDLWWIGVRPSRHGAGHGTALLACVEDHVRRAGGRILVIETSATPALAATRDFYRRRGYRVCGTLPDYYSDGDGKVTFAKAVAAPGEADVA